MDNIDTDTKAFSIEPLHVRAAIVKRVEDSLLLADQFGLDYIELLEDAIGEVARILDARAAEERVAA